MKGIRRVLLWGALGLLVCPLPAADWPQFLGPQRNGTVPEKDLTLPWPAGGPRLLWRCPVGEGYSGPVVVGGRLILFHRLGGEEVVEAMTADRGQRLWRFAYPCDYEDDFGVGNGPRATPLVAGRRVYTLGVTGWLHCLDLEDGRLLWKRDLVRDYAVPQNFFGVGSSPVLAGSRLLLNLGGKEAGILALEADSGKEVWRATRDGASYASPLLASLAGRPTAVFFTRQGVVLLDPDSGAVRYQRRWRSRSQASVNAASPVVVGDLVFVSACYETGALLLRVRPQGVEEVWHSDAALSCHYNTPIYYRGHLYGIDGRQESGARLRCLELASGKVRWTREDFGCASLLLVGDKLLALTERGDLVAIQATPAGYQELARAAILQAPPCRAEPALANGRLYARDRQHLACWDLRR
jgi:outer membrane protein assembly factor BamB